MKHENQRRPMLLKVNLMNELMIWLSNLQKLAGTSLRGGRHALHLSVVISGFCPRAPMETARLSAVQSDLSPHKKSPANGKDLLKFFFKCFKMAYVVKRSSESALAEEDSPKLRSHQTEQECKSLRPKIWSNHDLSAAAVALLAIPPRRTKLMRARRRSGKAKGSCQTSHFLFFPHKQWTQWRKTIRC